MRSPQNNPLLTTSGVETDDGDDRNEPQTAQSEENSLDLSVLAARLAKESELQSMLASERIRSQTHRDNYGKLKREFEK